MKSLEIILTLLVSSQATISASSSDTDPPCKRLPTYTVGDDGWGWENEKPCRYTICSKNDKRKSTLVKETKFRGKPNKGLCMVVVKDTSTPETSTPSQNQTSTETSTQEPSSQNQNSTSQGDSSHKFDHLGIQAPCSELPSEAVTKDNNGAFWSTDDKKKTACRIYECLPDITPQTPNVQSKNNLYYWKDPEKWCLLVGQDITKSTVKRCTDDPSSPDFKVVHSDQDWYKEDKSCRVYFCNADVKADGNSKTAKDNQGKDRHFANIGGEWCMII